MRSRAGLNGCRVSSANASSPSQFQLAEGLETESRTEYESFSTSRCRNVAELLLPDQIVLASL